MRQGRIASTIIDVMMYVWCERRDTEYLEFNCKRCEFEQDGKCLAKRFIGNHYDEQPEFPKGMIKESED